VVDAPACPWVLDTNIVLDLLVFDDPAVRGLRAALDCASARWLVTAGMRDELARVLSYPQVASRLPAVPQAAHAVLDRFDRLSHSVAVAPLAPVRCSDRDDQIFVDLAVAHRATLLSKDRQVLRLRRRLAGLGVHVGSLSEARFPAGWAACSGGPASG
jgi:predicted nucleic acid-binding protein